MRLVRSRRQKPAFQVYNTIDSINNIVFKLLIKKDYEMCIASNNATRDSRILLKLNI